MSSAGTVYDIKWCLLSDAKDVVRVHMQEVKQTIDQYEMLIQSMVRRSVDVPPLTMRSERHTGAVPVIALCSYKHLNVRHSCTVISLLFLLTCDCFTEVSEISTSYLLISNV